MGEPESELHSRRFGLLAVVHCVHYLVHGWGTVCGEFVRAARDWGNDCFVSRVSLQYQRADLVALIISSFTYFTTAVGINWPKWRASKKVVPMEQV